MRNIKTQVTITGTRNGKRVTKTFDAEMSPGGTIWLAKCYGATGYTNAKRDTSVIKTYRGKVVMTEVTGLEDLAAQVYEIEKTR